jgi:hypothetical protein
MLLRATVSPAYLWRLAAIAAICLFMGGWFLFDGLWTYPRQRERALEYQRLKTEDRLAEWQSLAQQRGWRTEDPGKPKSRGDIVGQLSFVALLVPSGLIVLVCFLRARTRWIELTETGLRTSVGQQLQFDQIATLNKRLWVKKGIAKLVYCEGRRARRLVLDDWKFETDPMRAILREIESHIDVTQIVGGEPEPTEGDQP